MKKLGVTLTIIFICLSAFYFFILKPEKYSQNDLYEEIMQRGFIKVGINKDSQPFGFINNKGEICGYDADLAKYIAQYILGNRDKIEFIPVTPSNRLLKVSTGEVDIVIATMTITPQRKKIIDFSIPYDTAGQALLVKKTSKIKPLLIYRGEI